MKQLLQTIDALQPKYLQLWQQLCSLESPTSDKAAVDAAGDCLQQLAREQGWHLDVMEHPVAGNPFCVTINPQADAPAVVFSGHIDTVFPIGLFGTPAVRTDGEKIYGPGVTDCKGGVVASFMALEALERCGYRRRPVKVIVQTDEETSSKTSAKQTLTYMMAQAKGAVAFLNTEGTDGDTAVICRKGILRCRFTVTGRAGHSSRCYRAANAVTEAAHKIIALEQLKDPEGLTCNCGVIQGGTVANSVAEQCVFTADIRFADQQQLAQAQLFVRQVAEHTTVPGCSCQVEEVSQRPSMPLVERNVQLLNTMNEIYRRAGLPVLRQIPAVGGSDAAYSTLAGIPSVDSIGVDGDKIHSVREFAWLNSLAQCAKRLAAVAWEI